MFREAASGTVNWRLGCELVPCDDWFWPAPFADGTKQFIAYCGDEINKDA